MVKGNKASQAVSWGLVGLLGLAGAGCGPETMSLEKAMKQAQIVYLKEGQGFYGMIAIKQYVKDRKSNNAGKLYIPLSFIPHV